MHHRLRLDRVQSLGENLTSGRVQAAQADLEGVPLPDQVFLRRHGTPLKQMREAIGAKEQQAFLIISPLS
ncbi:hypothetical protein ABS71_18375 [bacterium SCN 62-11]|nr:MAG: hypothetical protein ABS71_18375 [bacterium SCN 62-11]